MAIDSRSTLSVVIEEPEPLPRAASSGLETSNDTARIRPGQFLVRLEPRHQSLRDAFAVLAAKIPSEYRDDLREARRSAAQRTRHSKVTLLSSAMFHFSVVFFVVRVPLSMIFGDPSPVTRRQANTPIVYRLETKNLSQYLPSPQPAGPGGAPGRGAGPHKAPARGSAAFHPKTTIVSNPARPNNDRQTIVQNATPPELKLEKELRLPNMVISSPIMSPQFPTAVPLSAPVRTSAKPEDPPKLQIPTVPYPTADLPFPLAPADIPKPSFPVPQPLPFGPPTPQRPATDVAGLGGSDKKQGDAPGLTVVGVNPAGLNNLLVMLPGNREGSFPISPAGGRPGSPGGIEGGGPSGANGEAGPGGDSSLGIGSGKMGGGGGANGGGGLGGAVGINGSGGAGSGASGGTFVYSDPTSLVYPLLSVAPVVPINPLVVSTGPAGGGGLDAYGVLPCHKIYTIYLPMPGKNWIFQYCAQVAEAEKAPGNVVKMDEGLAPPLVLERFDFLRPSPTKEPTNTTVVLRGVIGEDGAISQLKLQRSSFQAADEGALAAFGRWKFRAALRNSKPVTVHFLVGVPAILEKK